MWWLVLCLCASAHGLQVITTEGTVEGNKAADGDYFAFYGIPYAGPTAGVNRFKAPVPPSPYPGPFHAIDNNVICSQPTSRGLIGVENCLTLSIFTKNVTTPKPVIVWLNAEQYTTTNTQMMSYRRFVEDDTVFVPMNFRLSIFGFLCLGVAEAPGNAGLRDVIQGLKWIQANIANFGGNANNVTLMGHGSGAAMVDLLTLSKQTENLVHKAIALSGSALEYWAVAYDPVGYAHLLGDKLGYEGKTNADLARHLISTDITVLNTALNEFTFNNNTPLFAPCIENVNLTPNDTVINDAPINIFKSGNYNDIPIIYTYTTREGTLRAEEAAIGNWLAAMDTNITNFLPVDLRFGNNVTAVSASIRDFYFSGKSVSMETIEDYLDYFGDTLILFGVVRAAKERAQTSNSEVRLMEFGFMGTLNSDWTYNQIPLTGVRHGGLLNYLFEFDLRPIDETARKPIMDRIVTFARTGSQNQVNETVWNPISSTSTHYLQITGGDGPVADLTAVFGQTSRINPHSEIINFWTGLYNTYYVTPPQFSGSSITLSCFFVLLLCQLFVKLF